MAVGSLFRYLILSLYFERAKICDIQNCCRQSHLTRRKENWLKPYLYPLISDFQFKYFHICMMSIFASECYARHRHFFASPLPPLRFLYIIYFLTLCEYTFFPFHEKIKCRNVCSDLFFFASHNRCACVHLNPPVLDRASSSQTAKQNSSRKRKKKKRKKNGKQQQDERFSFHHFRISCESDLFHSYLLRCVRTFLPYFCSIFEILFYIKNKLSVKIVHSIKSDSRVWFILPQWRCLPFRGAKPLFPFHF